MIREAVREPKSRTADSRSRCRESRRDQGPICSVVDLCCGMGGISLAASQIGMRIVAGVDTNPSALKTFRRGFPEAQSILGDIRSDFVLEQCSGLLATSEARGSPFIVVSGPPCQGFSAAGPRDPDDPRNQVMSAVASAVTYLHPLCALVENVATVLALKNRQTLGEFNTILVGGGYNVVSIVLDAGDFGLAQKRRRAFFLVTKSHLSIDEVLGKLATMKCPATSAEEALFGLPMPAVRPDSYDDEAESGTIPNHLVMRHSQRVIDKIATIEPGTGPMSYRRLHPSRASNTLFSGHRAPPAHYSEPRSITVREAARLQGFPDSFRVYGAFANQMEQVTNAVPPPLALAVLRVLLNSVDLSVQRHV